MRRKKAWEQGLDSNQRVDGYEPSVMDRYTTLLQIGRNLPCKYDHTIKVKNQGRL